MFLTGPYNTMLGSPITVFQNISSGIFHIEMKGGEGVWGVVENGGGNGGCRQGKA